LGDALFDLAVGGIGSMVGEAEQENGPFLGVEVFGFGARDHETGGFQGEPRLVQLGGHKIRLDACLLEVMPARRYGESNGKGARVKPGILKSISYSVFRA